MLAAPPRVGVSHPSVACAGLAVITRVMRPVLRIAFCALLPLRKRHWKAEIAAIWFVRSLGICRRKPRACGSRIFDRIRDSHSRFERNRSSSRYIDHTIIIYIMMIDEIDQEIRPSTYYLLTFVRRYPYVLIIITYHMILFFLAYYHIISYYYY